MAFIDYTGTFLNYDLEENIITIKLDFITPEEQDKLEQAVTGGQRHSFRHKVKNNSSVSQQQRECWYGSLRTIIVESELLPTSERMRVFDNDMRRRFFPAVEVDFGDLDRHNEDGIPEPKRMREMTHEEMGNAINGLHQLYDNVDWSKYLEIK